MEKYDFIKIMLKSRNLSVNDKKRLLLLATREIEQQNIKVPSLNEDITIALGEEKLENKEPPHAPKDTTSFLSLFNDPNGFKFLTHDFDPDSDMNYDKLIDHSRDVFKKESSKYRIPKNLYALMSVMLYGGKKDDDTGRTWIDFEGKSHSENYATPSWIEWCKQNSPSHPLSNDEFSKTILKFRSSIRLVKPVLADIVERQELKHSDLIINTEGLEKADFYTYVLNLENGIKRILDDMSRYSSKTPNVNISFVRKYSDDFSSRIIRICQIGSVSSSIEDVLSRFHAPEGAGAFNEIKKVFTGYCNWSVEALWDGKPLRWNILTDTDAPEIEEINDSNILGFTHILTYFSK